MAAARITGQVLGHRLIEGSNDRGPYSFLAVRVLVVQDVSEITYAKGLAVPDPGTHVDVLCDLSAKGRLSVVADWPHNSEGRKAA
jgi:hypothetical protein